MSDAQAVVVIDYQNMHLTARGQFTPQGTPTHHSLIHPLYLANQVLIARAAAISAANASGRTITAQVGPIAAQLARVEAFRGLPSNSHDPKPYARSLAQKAEWTRDPRVEVSYRPLRYQWENGTQVPREKGIDVLVALKLVELAQSGTYDLVILAAHDTDLEPALEAAIRAASSGQPGIETAGWQSCKRLRPQGLTLWHTFLGASHFQAARDRKHY
jgi:hypothetical protein